MLLNRRRLISTAPAAGLATLIGGCASLPTSRSVSSIPEGLHRIDEEARILAVAREIIAEDWVATFITIDDHGVPRARSVGISDPDPDLTMWISTRRGSRKIEQVRRHPQATVHFAKDALAENFRGAYYASFMGEASVHIDDEEMAAHVPEEAVRTANWPNYRQDYAVIRFKPRWFEVYGRGISGKPETWQPQAVVLPS